MQMTPQISVIVPVYKAEKYLQECVESILRQTFTSFELLLIEDGSPDQSGALCDQLALTDPRIRVVHKQNEGAGMTRCRGVQAALGEWVTFVDSDDTLPPDALESLYAQTEGTDIVVSYIGQPQMTEPISLLECRRSLVKADNRFPPSPCAKLYRRWLLTPDVFDLPRDFVIGEDFVMNVRVIFKTERDPHFVFRHNYFYRPNLESTSHTNPPSLAYEEWFDRLRTGSIPEAERPALMPWVIAHRINSLGRVGLVEPEKIVDRKNPYMQLIRKDIRRYHYHYRPKQWLLLHIHSAAVMRWFCRRVL